MAATTICPGYSWGGHVLCHRTWVFLFSGRFLQVKSGGGYIASRRTSFNSSTALNRYVILAKTSIFSALKFLIYDPEQRVILTPRIMAVQHSNWCCLGSRKGYFKNKDCRVKLPMFKFWLYNLSCKLEQVNYLSNAFFLYVYSKNTDRIYLLGYKEDYMISWIKIFN